MKRKKLKRGKKIVRGGEQTSAAANEAEEDRQRRLQQILQRMRGDGTNGKAQGDLKASATVVPNQSEPQHSEPTSHEWKRKKKSKIFKLIKSGFKLFLTLALTAAGVTIMLVIVLFVTMDVSELLRGLLDYKLSIGIGIVAGFCSSILMIVGASTLYSELTKAGGPFAEEIRTRSPSELFEWFQKNKESLLKKNCSPEFSKEFALEVVCDYADVLAQHHLFRDASLLPYPKETIRVAINQRIQRLIEENGDGSPTPELETQINQLGAAKAYLIEFQHIDSQDREAIKMLNSCPRLFAASDNVKSYDMDFLSWWGHLSHKYVQRAAREGERGSDTTIVVKPRRDASPDSNQSLLNESRKTNAQS